ncbi:MAG: adenosine kinase, partial [Bacteroidales bacterium]|nr:adenosine kinase [Bacteroidales bacterium]
NDTTGAGDLFAAGFLYGYLQGFDLDKSGKIGSILAGNVVEVIGPKMDAARWQSIKAQIAAL